eukprot:TRINITY_DN4486_c0_g1_i3.p1 TRINITY_DN4486_c0_g1~~TRINITY_DN4486_c0_g1_i3.p1  ORF type:complete len:702 (-),score=139.23 TRINITY_DN4486_c0_g1_i3:578-2683(-)
MQAASVPSIELGVATEKDDDAVVVGRILSDDSPRREFSNGSMHMSTNPLAFSDVDVQGKTPRNFIRVNSEGEAASHVPAFSTRRLVRQIFRNPYCDFFAGLVILIDFLAICRDTDAQAGEGEADRYAKWTMLGCFLFYCFELSLRTFAYGLKIFASRTNMIDAFVIGLSMIEYTLELTAQSQAGLSLIMLRMIRLCRLLRLMRVVKLFSGMKELRRLLQMITTCARTLFWSFLMSFLVMSMWAVLAVELVHPVAKRLAEVDTWPGCERCERAFGSVMAANLTFFQTILAGDSWGFLAVPICEESPTTAIVFVGALLTLAYGVMQMITAVVVDSFADLRRLDVNSIVTEMDAEERQEKDVLAKIFNKVDADRSGYISYWELADGARRVNEFQNWLRVMDVDATDLERLFSIIDEDASGEVDLTEFIDALYRMKNAESRTATKFVKHMVENMEKKTNELFDSLGDLSRLSSVLQNLQSHLQRLDGWQPGSDQDSALLRNVEVAVQRASRDILNDAVLMTGRSCSSIMSRNVVQAEQEMTEWKCKLLAGGDGPPVRKQASVDNGTQDIGIWVHDVVTPVLVEDLSVTDSVQLDGKVDQRSHISLTSACKSGSPAKAMRPASPRDVQPRRDAVMADDGSLGRGVDPKQIHITCSSSQQQACADPCVGTRESESLSSLPAHSTPWSGFLQLQELQLRRVHDARDQI